jgi:hypothetical protein
MNLDGLSKKKKTFIVGVFLLPLVMSIGVISYLYLSSSDGEAGEQFSPVENKPLFVGLIFFILGYLFFLGMLFSENILTMINKRRNIGV